MNPILLSCDDNNCDCCDIYRCKFNINPSNPNNIRQRYKKNMNIRSEEMLETNSDSDNKIMQDLSSKYNDIKEKNIDLESKVNNLSLMIEDLKNQIEIIPMNFNSNVIEDSDENKKEADDFGLAVYDPSIETTEKILVEKKGFFGLGKSKWVEENK